MLSDDDKQEWEEMERKDKERETSQKAKMAELKAAWRAENLKDRRE